MDTGDATGGTAAIREELESVRQPPGELATQLAELQAMLETSRQWIGLSDDHFRDAMSASLELLGAQPRPAWTKPDRPPRLAARRVTTGRGRAPAPPRGCQP